VIIKDVLGGILLLYLLIWAFAMVEMVFLAAVLVVSRGRSDAVRDVFRRSVVAGSPKGSVRASKAAPSAASVRAALEGVRAADPDFSESAFLDGTRLAVGAYAMAVSAEDDRLLRRVTTPHYWQTTNGKAVAAMVANWKRYAGERSGATNRGRLLLDISWRQPEIRYVSTGEDQVDRITVRLASVIVGAIRLGWQRTDEASQLDWDFVRPSGQKTDPYAVILPRTCSTCGSPYGSDFDDACPHCHAPRPGTQAGWRLDGTHLVIDS
jgi:predicted lipid-binding transport protein (Tim44 family)